MNLKFAIVVLACVAVVGVVANNRPRCKKWHKHDFSKGAFVFTDGPGQFYKHHMQECWHVQNSCKGRVICEVPKCVTEDGYDFYKAFLKKKTSYELLEDDIESGSVFYAGPGEDLIFNLITDYSVAEPGFKTKCSCEASEDNSVLDTDNVVVKPFIDENARLHNTKHIHSKAGAYCRRGGKCKFGVSKGFDVQKLKITVEGSGIDDGADESFTLEKGKPGKFGLSFDGEGPYNLNLSPNAPVGAYDVDLYDGRNNMAGNDYRVVVLFNPWNKECEEYLSDDAQRKEYVLNCVGNQYTGSRAKPFKYSCDDPAVVDAALKTLDGLSCKGRQSAAMCIRFTSEVVAAEILEGNWSGDYKGGRSPGSWNDAGEILTNWAASGDIQKFGQCWVYAAVGNAVGRSLGLATRSATNMASAHEEPTKAVAEPQPERGNGGGGGGNNGGGGGGGNNGGGGGGSNPWWHPSNWLEEGESVKSGSLPKTDFDGVCHYQQIKKNGKWEVENRMCSIWNFHVWNNAWFRRSKDEGDLSDYNGEHESNAGYVTHAGEAEWQSFDYTYQEASTHDDQMRCGPAAQTDVRHGRHGRQGAKFDGRFIRSEVDSDIQFQECTGMRGGKPTGCKDTGSPNTCHVGKNLYTDGVGTGRRSDIQDMYKNDAHCGGRRFRFSTRHDKDHGIPHHTQVKHEPAKKGDAECTADYGKTVVPVGDDLSFSVKCNKKCKIVGRSDVMAYVGREKAGGRVMEATHDANTATFTIKASDYMKKLEEEAIIQHSFSATCGQHTMFGVEQVAFITPALKATIKPFAVGTKGELHVTVDNTKAKTKNPIDLKGCRLSRAAEGSPAKTHAQGREVANIKADSSFTFKRHVKCAEAGKRKVSIAVTCDGYLSFSGETEVECLKSTQQRVSKQRQSKSQGVKKYGAKKKNPQNKKQKPQKVVEGKLAQQKKQNKRIPGSKPKQKKVTRQERKRLMQNAQKRAQNTFRAKSRRGRQSPLKKLNNKRKRGKRGPKRPKRGPKRGKRGPKRPKRGPKRGKRGPKRPKRGPKRGQKRSKRGPKRGKRGQKRGKRTLSPKRGSQKPKGPKPKTSKPKTQKPKSPQSKVKLTGQSTKKLQTEVQDILNKKKK